MANKIALISDDSNFFEYIKLKLELRTSDVLYNYSFDEVPENFKFLESSVVIINSENSKQKTLDLLKMFNGTPAIVVAYNDDDKFKKKCYRAGMLDFIPLLTPDSEFRARMLPALTTASIIEKNNQYRQLLVNNNIVSKNNEVFLEYDKIISSALEQIKKSSREAVFGAISPDDKNKFFIKSNKIEAIVINNIRKNDVLINYAPTKYYIILYDTDLNSAERLWNKIAAKFQNKIYAGFTQITNQNKQQLINTVLSKLSEAINSEDTLNNKNYLKKKAYQNFKLFRKEFEQKLEQTISPVFYSIQQKYMNKLTGVKIEVDYGEGFGEFIITSKHYSGSMQISSPGFSKILVDISIKKKNDLIDSKRITFEPQELESGLLNDLLEQFLSEMITYLNKI